MREDMKPGEFVALGLALEALVRPKAEARMADARIAGNRNRHDSPAGVNDNSRESRPRRTHDEVAKALWVGGTLVALACRGDRQDRYTIPPKFPNHA